MTTTLYTEINDSLFAKLAKIKLLVCDVDGVFSDGRIYLVARVLAHERRPNTSRSLIIVSSAGSK